MSREKDSSDIPVNTGGEKIMDKVNALEGDVRELKIGQVELGFKFDGLMEVFKVQTESTNKVLKKLEESTEVQANHLRELERRNDNIEKESAIKEKQIELEFVKLKNKYTISDMRQDIRNKDEKIKDSNDSFWMRLKRKAEDRIIEIIIWACILGYMAFHGLPIK